ncbi:MAG: DNA polymerase III subunit gamma/tau [Acetivibrionales bacterium]|jgi:DNA polymerase-3 subunit gamma/tau|nr:DNA polymerase III subunit gamma/tau [Clostridiaceae bacterium]
MAHMALYRKWRPMTFEDVIEQRHIVTTLKNSIKNNTVSHAYLFCGTRGTGKTTLAKIFARAINCLNPSDGSPCNECLTCKGILDGSVIDVIEIDAASNNGVDDVREIKEAVMYVPAVTRYKVYIIDEVHMLSTGAFNALLKTLEEPPANVVFILATTEPHKLPATILSRCQRFDFKRITNKGIEERLKDIAKDCGVSIEDDAIRLIARISEGGMRDAISLLDQCITIGNTEITHKEVIEISGLSAAEAVDSFAKAIVNKDAHIALNAIKDAMEEGRDLKPFCNQLIMWFRNLMLIKTGGEALSLVDLSDEELRPIKEAANIIDFDRTLKVIQELSETESQLRWAENPRIIMEVTAVKLCSDVPVYTSDSDDVLSKFELRLRQIEERVSQIQQGVAIKPGHTAKKARPANLDSEKPSQNEEKKIVKKSKEGDSGAGNINKLQEWPEVIEYIRSQNKMKVYAYLLDTWCFISKDGTANVVVQGDDALKKTVLSRNDSLDVIKNALGNVLGHETNVKVIEEKKMDTVSNENEADPVLERIKQLASDNNIPLNIEE